MKEFFKHFDKMFRYFLSGVMTIWFLKPYLSWLKLGDKSSFSALIDETGSFFLKFVDHERGWPGLVLFAFITLVIGSVIYVINRYVIITGLEYVFFHWFNFCKCFWKRFQKCFCKCFQKKKKRQGYTQVLTSFLQKRFNVGRDDKKIFPDQLSEHLFLRRAHGHFLLFLSEFWLIVMLVKFEWFRRFILYRCMYIMWIVFGVLLVACISNIILAKRIEEIIAEKND